MQIKKKAVNIHTQSFSYLSPIFGFSSKMLKVFEVSEGFF